MDISRLPKNEQYKYEMAEIENWLNKYYDEHAMQYQRNIRFGLNEYNELLKKLDLEANEKIKKYNELKGKIKNE